VTLFSINGQPYRHEYSVDEIKQFVNHLEELKEVIRCKTIGISPEFDSLQLNKFSKILHKSTLQSFLCNKHKNQVIICDEFIIRMLFHKEFNINSTSTYVLLHYLKLKGKITQEKYNRCLYEMVTYGYLDIPIDCNVIYQSLKDYEFNVKNIYFKSVIKYLLDPSVTENSAKRVFRDFSKLLYYKNLSSSLKVEILNEIKIIEKES
jgi:hypothetical protein